MMPIGKRAAFRACSLFLLLFAALPLRMAQASPYAGLLTFDFSPCHACYNLRQIGQDYGDVAGLIDFSYLNVLRPGESLRMWDKDYNDLQNVAYASGGNADGASHGRIELRALGGRAVSLLGMDFGAWANATRVSHIRVSEIGRAAPLFAYDGEIGLGSSGHTGFSLDLASTDGLWIDWFSTATDVGIDNLRFTVSDPEPVPEPAALALVLTGLLALAWRRRPQPRKLQAH